MNTLEKGYLRYWLMLLISLFCFTMGLKTNQFAGGAMAVILLVASNMKNDNKKLQLISKILVIIITSITVYLTFFIDV